MYLQELGLVGVHCERLVIHISVETLPLSNLMIWAMYGPSMEMVWHKLWPIYGQYMALVWAIASISKLCMPLSSFSFDSIVLNYRIAIYLAQFHRFPIVSGTGMI